MSVQEGFNPLWELWDTKITRSQRTGASALLGVYGVEVQEDEILIDRALRGELTTEEISVLDALRPIGEKERFGPGGKYGWHNSNI